MDWDGVDGRGAPREGKFARLINASADEIAVFSSVSEATSAVASALDFTGPRPRVVVTEAEFPTVGHVWLAQKRRGARRRVGARCATARSTPESYDACSRRADGARVGLSRLLPERRPAGPDATWRAARTRTARCSTSTRTRTLGTFPVDVRATGVDFLASGNLKFLMGIPGIAFLYVRREHIGTLATVDDRMVRPRESLRVRRRTARLVADREPVRQRDAADHQRVHRARRDGDHQRDRRRRRFAPGTKCLVGG